MKELAKHNAKASHIFGQHESQRLEKSPVFICIIRYIITLYIYIIHTNLKVTGQKIHQYLYTFKRYTLYSLYI